jgi:hypothetical protein
MTVGQVDFKAVFGALLGWQGERSAGNQGVTDRICRAQYALMSWRNGVRPHPADVPRGMEAVLERAFPHYSKNAELSALGRLQNLLNGEGAYEDELIEAINAVNEAFPGFAESIKPHFQVADLKKLRIDIEKVLFTSINKLPKEARNSLHGDVWQNLGHGRHEDHFGENHLLDNWDIIGLSEGLTFNEKTEPLAAPHRDAMAAAAPGVDLEAKTILTRKDQLYVDYSGEVDTTREIYAPHLYSGPQLRVYYYEGDNQQISRSSTPDALIRLNPSMRHHLPAEVRAQIADIADHELQIDIRLEKMPVKQGSKPWHQFILHYWAHGNNDVTKRYRGKDPDDLNTKRTNPLKMGVFCSDNIHYVENAGFANEMPISEMHSREQIIHDADGGSVCSPANNQVRFGDGIAHGYFVAKHERPTADTRVCSRETAHNQHKRAIVSLMLFGNEVGNPETVRELLGKTHPVHRDLMGNLLQ